MARTATLTLSLGIVGLAPISLSATGATVMVDGSGGLGCRGQITIAAQAITLPTPISVPVTASTAIAALTATTIDNLSAAFSFGGAGDLPTSISTTELPCPTAFTATGVGCFAQTGFGGQMGLSGTINVVVVPGLVTIPVQLQANGFGQGGHIAGSFIFDAAPWTLPTSPQGMGGTGSVAVETTSTYMTPFMAGSITGTNTWTTTVTQMGTISASGSKITLVSPTFVSALGNLLPLLSEFTIEFTDGGGLPSFPVPIGCPEPRGLLMLGSVFAALAVLGRGRRR